MGWKCTKIRIWRPKWEVSEWVSRVLRPVRHTIGHFGDESFQTITCAGTDRPKRETFLGMGSCNTPDTRSKTCTRLDQRTKLHGWRAFQKLHELARQTLTQETRASFCPVCWACIKGISYGRNSLQYGMDWSDWPQQMPRGTSLLCLPLSPTTSSCPACPWPRWRHRHGSPVPPGRGSRDPTTPPRRLNSEVGAPVI